MAPLSKLNLSLSNFLKKQFPDTYQFNQMLVEKGLQNAAIISDYMYRSWPFWISKQLKPNQTPHISDTNYLGLINTKYRNWTFLSSPNTSNAVIIDPVGLINVKEKSFSVDFWISNSNSLFIPSHKDDILQRYIPESNSVLTSFSLSQLNIESHVMFSTLPDNLDFSFCNYKITNNTKKNIKFSFYISIRPFDFEGVTDIQSIQYLQNGMFLVDNQLAIILDQKPDNVVCLSHDEGDVSEHFNKLEMIFTATCPIKKVSAFAEYRLVISPNNTISLSFKIPCSRKQFSKLNVPFFQSQSSLDLIEKTYQSFSFDKSIKELTFYNADLINHDFSFSLPDSNLTEFVRSQFSFLMSSIGSSSFKHGFYQELNHSLLDHLIFMKALYIGGYKPTLFSHIFSLKYLQTLLSDLQSQKLSFSGFASWFQTLLFLQSVHVISITYDMYKLLFKLITLGLSQLKHYDKLNCPTLPPRFSLKTYQKTIFLSDLIGLLSSLQSFQTLSKNLPHANLEIYKNNNLNYYRLLITNSIETFCSFVSNKIVFNDIIPVSSTTHISLDLIKTLALYAASFPNKKSRIKQSLLLIQKHLVYNNLIFSMINPSGFSVSHNIDYIALMNQVDPKAVYTIINSLLSYVSPTYTLPDVIHPVTKGGSEGDGHNLKHGTTLSLSILHTILYDEDKCLRLFSAIPPHWLSDSSWYINHYRLSQSSVSLSIKQSPIDTTIEITCSKPKSYNFFIINTHYHYKSFIINDTEIAIKSPIIKIPGSETSIRFIKHHEPTTLN